MFLSLKHRKQFAIFYFVCFVIYYGWYYFHGLLLHQLAPVFFHNRPDLTVNIIMLTDVQHAVMNSHPLQMLLDCSFILLPLSLCISCVAGYRVQYFLAVLTAVFNLLYAILLSLMSPLSIEGFTGWMLLPLIFTFKKEVSFYYALQTMRYFFLLIFFSAALWKIRAGGLFNTEQMSAILLKQHAAYLVTAPGNWFSKFINYLVIHKQLSYIIYLAAGLGELVFVIGFFTRKYDKLLIIIFIAFVSLDYFLMRINYFSWTAFLGCLWFSRHKLNQQV